MLIDFLKTTRSKEELKTALEVLREFLDLETTEEYCMSSFESWEKFEQLFEFLAHLVEDTPLEADTLAQIEIRYKLKENHDSATN